MIKREIRLTIKTLAKPAMRHPQESIPHGSWVVLYSPLILTRITTTRQLQQSIMHHDTPRQGIGNSAPSHLHKTLGDFQLYPARPLTSLSSSSSSSSSFCVNVLYSLFLFVLHFLNKLFQLLYSCAILLARKMEFSRKRHQCGIPHKSTSPSEA